MTRDGLIEVMQLAGNITRKQATAILSAIEAAGVRLVNFAALAEDDAAGGPEVKLRSVAQSLRATAAEGKNTIIMPDAAETFAAALTLAADIFEQWQARAAIRALGE